MVNAEAKFAEFEQLGEAVVRDYVAQRRYNDVNHQLALNWLALRDRQREEAAAAELKRVRELEISLASRAADATERSASAAEDAAKSAREANDSAREANDVARDANLLAASANTLASAANNLARDAIRNSRYAWIAAAISAAVAILALVLRR